MAKTQAGVKLLLTARSFCISKSRSRFGFTTRETNGDLENHGLHFASEKIPESLLGFEEDRSSIGAPRCCCFLKSSKSSF